VNPVRSIMDSKISALVTAMRFSSLLGLRGKDGHGQIPK
jgi:hypothetical protein